MGIQTMNPNHFNWLNQLIMTERQRLSAEALTDRCTRHLLRVTPGARPASLGHYPKLIEAAGAQNKNDLQMESSVLWHIQQHQDFCLQATLKLTPDSTFP